MEGAAASFSSFERTLLSEAGSVSGHASPSSPSPPHASASVRKRRPSLSALLTHVDNLTLETKTIYDVAVLGSKPSVQHPYHPLPIPQAISTPTTVASTMAHYTRDSMAIIFVRFVNGKIKRSADASKPFELVFKAEVRFRQSFADIVALVWMNLCQALGERDTDTLGALHELTPPPFSLVEMRPIMIQNNNTPAYTQLAIWIESVTIPLSGSL